MTSPRSFKIQEPAMARFTKTILLCLPFYIFISEPCFAGLHFSLSGSFSDNNIFLMQQKSRSASASIAVDLGTYLRVGGTHRQGLNDSKGTRLNEATQLY